MLKNSFRGTWLQRSDVAAISLAAARPGVNGRSNRAAGSEFSEVWLNRIERPRRRFASRGSLTDRQVVDAAG